MQGVNHCASGVAVGFATAPLLGMHSLATAIPYALTVGGLALSNDLDCDHAKASTALGPVSEFLSWVLRHMSSFAFTLTRGRNDKPSAGTHRHLTHTLVFALAAGELATLTGHMSLWVVAAWLVFGAVSASAALTVKAEGPPPRKTARVMLVLFLLGLFGPALSIMHTPSAVLLASLTAAQGWLGVAVTLGCLVHLVGDAMTVSGVPLFWPLPIRSGEFWHCVHFLPRKIRLHTGKRFEQWIVHPLFIGAIAGTAYILM
jgi:membrane-bound metal-dependent hydrolase YbcI (DUF457 family)